LVELLDAAPSAAELLFPEFPAAPSAEAPAGEAPAGEAPADEAPADPPDLSVEAAELDLLFESSAASARCPAAVGAGLPAEELVLLGEVADRAGPAGLSAVAADPVLPAAASSIEKASGLDCFELDDFVVPAEEEVVDEDRISSATCHQSMSPRARGAFVGFELFTPVERLRFLGLEAPHHLTDGFRALGGALPGLLLAISLRASANDNLCLLPQRLFEAGKKSLVVASHGAIHAGLGADRKASNVALEIALQLGKLRLALSHPALTVGQCLGATSLLIINDVLYHLQSLGALHSHPLSGGSGSVRLSGATVCQYIA
jgi:hypothetical protein